MIPADFPRRPSLVIATLLGTTALFALFVFWLATYQVEEVTKVTGTLEPTVGNAPVQFASGGVILELQVVEGQEVQAGDPLIRIDTLSPTDTVDSLKEQILVLESQRIRMQALSEERTLKASEFEGIRSDLKANQLKLFGEEMASYQASLEVFAAQIRSLNLQVRERQAEYAGTQKDRALVQEQLTIQTNLSKEGMASRSQLIGLQRELESLNSRLESLPLSVRQLKEDVAGVVSKRTEYIQNHIRDYRKELTRIDEELGILRARVTSDSKLNNHFVLTSPIAGTVSGLVKRRKGEVVAANEVVMEIIPRHQTFTANLKIPPAGMGYLRPGLPATVTIDAYATEPRAQLKGTLSELSASSRLDEKGLPYYRGVVTLTATDIALKRGSFELLSGMSLKAQILTGQRSLLEFIFNSIIKSSTDAFKER